MLDEAWERAQALVLPMLPTQPTVLLGLERQIPRELAVPLPRLVDMLERQIRRATRVI